jgi:PKHD-type hydroxylase
MPDNITFYNWYLEKVTNETWAYIRQLFSQEEVSKIIEISKNESLSSKVRPGLIGDDYSLDQKIRSCTLSNVRSDLTSNYWIFERITQSVNTINKQIFNFDLNEIETLQFTEYSEFQNGFYKRHTDMPYQGFGTRKLSFSVQLSDPESYEGGDLLLYPKQEGIKAVNGIGDIIFFPSYTLHEVTPVTKGVRCSLVGWIKGPQFK